jgi:hypothetical protein
MQKRRRYSRLFETGADYRFATRFDYSGAAEKVLAAELRIAHARGVLLEMVGVFAEHFGKFR